MIKLPRLSRLIAKNIKNASTSFKLRFLTQYSTKSRLQMLRECGNGRGTLWNREKRERVYLKSSIGLKSQLGCLESSKYILFYSVFGRNRPIETIDGYDKRPTIDRLISVIKTLDFRSLDRDPTAEMRSAPINRSRYNPLN